MARRITDIVSEGEVLGVVGGVAASVPLTDDQTAADVAFTPAGDLVSTDVQAALEELDTEKLSSVAVADIDATGTADSTTYLRGDGTWSTPAGGAATNASIIRRTTNQSIPNNTFWTAVTFDTETLDGGGWWASGDATKLYPSAGTVHVRASVPFATSATGARWVAIRHYNSGGTVLQTLSVTAPGISGVGTLIGVGDLFVVTAGDYFEVLVYQNSGGALNIEGSSTIPIQLTAFNL